MRVSEQLLGTPRAPTKYPGEQEQQAADGGDPEVDILGVSASGTGDGQQTVTGPGSTPADRFLLLSARWLVVQLPWPCRARAVNRLTARRYFLPNRQANRRVERVEGGPGSTDAGLIERERVVGRRRRLQNVCKVDLGRRPSRTVHRCLGCGGAAGQPTYRRRRTAAHSRNRTCYWAALSGAELS